VIPNELKELKIKGIKYYAENIRFEDSFEKIGESKYQFW
jgi:hypothetical protein